MTRTALIIGAGPAGLTAAHELLQRTQIKPIVVESDTQVGGISKTINYHGNRMDLGGHRFFSKSDWVMQWWQSMLPVSAEGTDAQTLALRYQGQVRPFTAQAADHGGSERVMLVRSRLSRILYRRRFFDYPLKVNWSTFRNLGPGYTAGIALSYAGARLAPRTPELTLEDFLVNRFGDKLYRTFFKAYTEKVWGVPCASISAEWGAQRIKGLSITKALAHALSRPFRDRNRDRRRVETSLIEHFLYPKLGPGQMWEVAAEKMLSAGGELHLRSQVIDVVREGAIVRAVDVRDQRDGSVRRIPCDFLVSTMPVKELTIMLRPPDARVTEIAAALPYRDFMTAGLLLRKMQSGDRAGRTSANGMPPDNWIYIQDADVKLGRLQVFNNWSPSLVADPNTIWLGLEYFCAQGDELWSMPDGTFLDFAAGELETLGLIDRADVMDGTVVRVPAAYPAYFGSYAHIGRVREFLDGIANLLPIGRNGMHRYNNQDHSMLTARAAVDFIASAGGDKSKLWQINADDDYHEDSAA